MKTLKAIYHLGMVAQFLIIYARVAPMISGRAEHSPFPTIPALYLLISIVSFFLSFKSYPLGKIFYPGSMVWVTEATAIFSPWFWKSNILVFAIGMIFLIITVITIITARTLQDFEDLSALYFATFFVLAFGSLILYKKARFGNLGPRKITLAADGTTEIEENTSVE